MISFRKDGREAEKHKVESSGLNKRSPLILVGEAPAYLREAVGGQCTLATLPSTNSYFLLFAPTDWASFARATEELLSAGVPADQILLAFEAGAAMPETLHAFAGKLWVSAGESLEELRHHLASALVAQRHRKLEAELERAQLAELPTQLDPAEWLRRFECAHLAHAFALAWELSPQQHGAALKRALHGDHARWCAELAPEAAVALTAELAQRHWRDPAAFREEFRREAAALPMRLRTELRTVAERCLEAFWRAHAPAA